MRSTPSESTPGRRLDAAVIIPPYAEQVIADCSPGPHYVAGYLRSVGHSCEVLNLNRDLVQRCLGRRATVEAEIDRLEQKLEQLEAMQIEWNQEAPDRARRISHVNTGTQLAGLRLILRLLQQRPADDPPDLIQHAALLHPYLREVFLAVLEQPLLQAYLAGRLDEVLAAPPCIRLADLCREALRGLVTERSPRVIGLSVNYQRQVLPALVIALVLRQLDGEIHICVGGTAATLLPDEDIARLLRDRRIDSIIRYDGEVPFSDLVRTMKRGEDPSGVANLVCREHLDRPRAPVHAPPPDWRHARIPLRAELGGAVVPIVQSRGCWWGRCRFCDYVGLYPARGAFNTRHAPEVVDDIEHYCAQGQRRFRLVCEDLPPGQALRFSQEVVRRGLKIVWTSYVRVHGGYTPEIFAAMTQSGFAPGLVGLETVCDRLLQVIDKGYDKATATRFFDSARAAGIRFDVLVIVGIPSSTFEEELETFSFCEAYADVGIRFVPQTMVITTSSGFGRGLAQYGLVRRELDPSSFLDVELVLSRANYVPVEPHLTPEQRGQIARLYGKLNLSLEARDRPAAAQRVIDATGADDLHDVVLVFPDDTQLLFEPTRFAPNGELCPLDTFLAIRCRDRLQLGALKDLDVLELPGNDKIVLTALAGRKVDLQQVADLIGQLSRRTGSQAIEAAFDFVRAAVRRGLLQVETKPRDT